MPHTEIDGWRHQNPLTIVPAAYYTVEAATPWLGSPDKQKRLRRECADLEFIRVGRDVFYTGSALLIFLAARARRAA